MNPDTLFVFVLIAAAAILFASGRVRLDIVALLVLLLLAVWGVLTEREALAGFGSPVVLIVAGLLVVGEMLTRTGVALAIGDWMAQVAGASSPVSSPVVTLVVEPGKYRFLDFVKLGGPLLLVTWIVNMLVTPRVFRF
jgi:di/tricarboxylate transporter